MTIKRPKDGSRKAEVFDIYMKTSDPDLAANRGEELELARGTVASWISEWSKATGKPGLLPKPKAAATPGEKKSPGDKTSPPRERLPAKPAAFDPWFAYPSRELAERVAKKRAESMGSSPQIFRVIENEGRFAIAPAHYKPDTIPTFKVGDIVYDLIVPNSKAKIIEAGPEQSVIKYLVDPRKGKSRPPQEAVPNVYLVKLEEEKKQKIKREKL
jgi:hypothetical protein